MPHPCPALLFFLAWNSKPGFGAYVVVLCFLLVGVLLFIGGFKKYREYRLLEDTPRAPVRSIPMGLVHLSGKATGEDRLSSPLTRTPCYYYKVVVEKWTKKGKDSEGWETIRTDKDERAFYLDDGTGKVVVNPHNAEYNLSHTFQAETGPRAGRKRYVDPALGVAGPSNQELHDYLQRVPDAAQAALKAMPGSAGQAVAKVMAFEQKLQNMGVSLSGGGLSMEFGGQTLRYTEDCLIAHRPCNILGTCVENPSPKDEHDRNLIQKGQNEPTFVISDKAEQVLEKSVRRGAFVMILIGGALIVGMVALVLGLNGWL